MCDVDVSVCAGHVLGPCLDRGPGDLDRGAARPADEVMVMVQLVASPVDGLTGIRAQDVDPPVVGKRLERAVDGRQPYLGAASAQHLVQFLRADEIVDLVENLVDGRALTRPALLSHRLLAHPTSSGTDAV
jgi:hypothetical protein